MCETRRLFLGLAIVAIGSCLVPAGATAVPAESVTLSRAVIARDVRDREPVGEASSFAANVGSLVCFTRVEGADHDTVIYHVWRHGDKLLAKVQLPVRSSSWRTWSKKRIDPSMTGPWTVEIEDADGNTLKTLSFSVGARDGDS